MKKILLTLLLLAFASSAFAMAEANGRAEAEFSGLSPKTALKQETRKKAVEKALDNYVKKDMGDGQRKLYRKHKDEIDMNEFVLNVITLGENIDKKLKIYDISVRVEIDDKSLNDTLNDFNETGADERGYVAALFIGREIASVKQYKAKETTTAAASGKRNAGADISVDNKGDLNKSGRLSQNESAEVKVVTGGNVELKLNEYTYKLRKDNIFPESFKSEAGNKGFTVTLYDDILNNCSSAGNVDALWQEINNSLVDNPQLKGNLRKLVINCAKELSAGFIIVGTVDIGVPEKSSSTGKFTVTATVTGTLTDIKGSLPKDVISGKPVMYNGTGSNADNAVRSAVQKAAEEFADYMVGQINAAGL